MVTMFPRGAWYLVAFSLLHFIKYKILSKKYSCLIVYYTVVVPSE
jgi:hypothetical protein